VPGLECENYLFRLRDARDVSFVHERPDAPRLDRLRRTFNLDSVIAGPGDEYDAMLRLGNGWAPLGSRYGSLVEAPSMSMRWKPSSWG